MRNNEEHRLQVACVNWFRLQYPQYAYVLLSFANGGARDVVTGRKLKEEGVVAGAPDLVLFVGNAKYHGLCIEMKTLKGKQSEAQILMRERLEDQYYHYTICRSFEDFRQTILKYISNI